jgi:superfamily II DNA or RNA helicase
VIIDTVSPTKAYIQATAEEIKILSEQMGYRNSSKYFELNKHLNRTWMRDRDPDEFERIKKDLESQVYVSLLYKENGRYFIRPGYIPYIKKIQIDVRNSINYPTAKPMTWKTPLEFTPYEYQTQSVERLLDIKHACVSLATGLGKSLILLMLSQRLGLNTVVVTPSQSIFAELLKLFQTHLGEKNVGAYGDGKKDIKKKITITIAKSLTTLKEGTEAYDFFRKKQVLIVDESHSIAAATLEDVAHGVLENIPYRFLVSATQARGDGSLKLLHSIIGQEVINMGVEEGIQKGYLCPLKFKILPVQSSSRKYVKDPIECKREHFLRNTNIAELAAKIANAKWETQQESTLILVEELGQIAMLAKRLTVPFTYVHSGSKKDATEYGLKQVDAQDEIERFNNGTVKVLIGTRAVSTGVNFYPTHVTLNWAGGSSEVTCFQGSMGRSTRKLENSKYKHLHKPKPFCMIIDFNVEGNKILEKQLEKRIEFYKETGEDVVL